MLACCHPVQGVLFCRSVCNQYPDIVIGTESWLSPDIFNGEIFPPGYTVFRADRKSKTRSGGVFIMVRTDIVCNEQPQFKTDCEILWVKIETTGVHPLFLCAFYRPKEENQDDLIELGKSIER